MNIFCQVFLDFNVECISIVAIMYIILRVGPTGAFICIYREVSVLYRRSIFNFILALCTSRF